MTGQPCSDPGHKVSIVGLRVSMAHKTEGRKGLASSTSCQHTKGFFLHLYWLRRGPTVQRIHHCLWELCLQGEHTENWLFYYVQTNINLFEVTEYLPSHTQVGVQEGNSVLAFDIRQACLDRTDSWLNLISTAVVIHSLNCIYVLNQVEEKKCPFLLRAFTASKTWPCVLALTQNRLNRLCVFHGCLDPVNKFLGEPCLSGEPPFPQAEPTIFSPCTEILAMVLSLVLVFGRLVLSCLVSFLFLLLCKTSCYECPSCPNCTLSINVLHV